MPSPSTETWGGRGGSAEEGTRRGPAPGAPLARLGHPPGHQGLPLSGNTNTHSTQTHPFLVSESSLEQNHTSTTAQLPSAGLGAPISPRSPVGHRVPQQTED